MLEYYESARHLNISSNQNIGIHGWQACANMIKKVQYSLTIKKYMNIISFKCFKCYFILFY